MCNRAMIRPRLELGTFCVLDRCDNQLRHRTLTTLKLWILVKWSHISEILKKLDIRYHSIFVTRTNVLYMINECVNIHAALI